MVDPITIGSILSLGETLISRIWPDENKRAEEMRKLHQIAQEGDLAKLQAHVTLMSKQIEVNIEQAKSKSFFVAGARPAAIWVGVISLAYQGILYPMLLWLWTYWQATGIVPSTLDAPPTIANEALMTITTGLLGVAAYRSYDKSKGVSTDNIGRL